MIVSWARKHLMRVDALQCGHQVAKTFCPVKLLLLAPDKSGLCGPESGHADAYSVVCWYGTHVLHETIVGFRLVEAGRSKLVGYRC